MLPSHAAFFCSEFSFPMNNLLRNPSPLVLSFVRKIGSACGSHAGRPLRNAAALAGGLLVLSQPAVAVPLFSIDTAANTLVRIDSTTGVVSTVGALGQDARDVDLTLTADGRLWGLNSGGSNVSIWEIDKITGAVLSSAQAFAGSVPVGSAEGLGSRGNLLRLGYDLTSGGNSITLGEISPGGAVTAGMGTLVDMDALADGHGNPYGLYAFDRDTLHLTTTLFGIDPLTGSSTAIHAYSSVLGFHDLVTFDNGEGIAIDTFTGDLHRLNLSTGAVLEVVGLSSGPSGVYNGLALAEPLSATVPDSAGFLPVIGIALALAFQRGGGGRKDRRRSRAPLV